jgi:hypothetical protein
MFRVFPVSGGHSCEGMEEERNNNFAGGGTIKPTCCDVQPARIMSELKIVFVPNQTSSSSLSVTFKPR